MASCWISKSSKYAHWKAGEKPKKPVAPNVVENYNFAPDKQIKDPQYLAATRQMIQLWQMRSFTVHRNDVYDFFGKEYSHGTNNHIRGC